MVAVFQGHHLNVGAAQMCFENVNAGFGHHMVHGGTENQCWRADVGEQLGGVGKELGELVEAATGVRV